MANCYHCFEPVASKKHPDGKARWKKDAHLMAAGGERSMLERRREGGIKEERQRWKQRSSRISKDQIALQRYHFSDLVLSTGSKT